MAGPRQIAHAVGEDSLMRHSVVMAGTTASELATHLLRQDGQEDLCCAMWMPSSGEGRLTAILQNPLLPRRGDRHVHGNASFEAAYGLRAGEQAAKDGKGLAFMHSHPHARGWQTLNEGDRVAESRLANIARELTGLPLLGLTLAGDQSWSARIWHGVGAETFPVDCESVRVVGDTLSVTFNPTILTEPDVSETQLRTVHTWGEETQADIARVRVAVAGVGSVGMQIADVLGRTGVQRVGVFDFDTVEMHNLDRLRGSRRLDVHLRRPKAHVAHRLLAEGSTAANPAHDFYELSVCEPQGFARLLDYDVIFSCVDRPWPRHVLNTIAYADLIPVIEGGLRVFRHDDDSLRNAYWRSTIARPGRPCLACLGQYDRGLIEAERDGSLDDPSYIADLPEDSPIRHRENVAPFSASVATSLLQQFVSYVAHPSGFGDPGPLRYSARDHSVEFNSTACSEHCLFSVTTGSGDARVDPTDRHRVAEEARRERAEASPTVQILQWLDDRLQSVQRRLHKLIPGKS